MYVPITWSFTKKEVKARRKFAPCACRHWCKHRFNGYISAGEHGMCNCNPISLPIYKVNKYCSIVADDPRWEGCHHSRRRRCSEASQLSEREYTIVFPKGILYYPISKLMPPEDPTADPFRSVIAFPTIKPPLVPFERPFWSRFMMRQNCVITIDIPKFGIVEVVNREDVDPDNHKAPRAARKRVSEYILYDVPYVRPVCRHNFVLPDEELLPAPADAVEAALPTEASRSETAFPPEEPPQQIIVLLLGNL